LPVVLYGCETWSLTLRDERRLRVLRRIFGPKRDELTRELRQTHNKDLNDLYFSTNIIWVIKSRRMRGAGYVARSGIGRAYTGFWWGNLSERDHLEDPCVDGRIIILVRWVFRKWDVWVWTGLIWLRIGTGGGLL